jgi:hypothetical protein
MNFPARTSAIANASFYAVVHLAGNLALLAVLTYGGKSVLNGVMTVGDLTSFLLYRYGKKKKKKFENKQTNQQTNQFICDV